MYRMYGNPSSPAAKHRLSDASPRLQSASSATSRRIRPARVNGRRKDNATFVAIAALLAILFATQVGWVVAQQQPHAQSDVSRT